MITKIGTSLVVAVALFLFLADFLINLGVSGIIRLGS